MNNYDLNGSDAVALVTDIQRFSVHDGPGIRTLVFFKGCPLRCKWCQNPETQRLDPEIMLTMSNCIGCGRCIEQCPNHAIVIEGDRMRLDRTHCTRCGACAAVCGPQARTLVGECRSFEDVLRNVMSDKVFYKNTGGGFTASGGEPTMQAEFVARLFRTLKKEGIHTAIETCGMCEENRFLQVIKNCDLLLYDIKHMDTEVHRRYTGFGNETILNNIQRAADQSKDIIVRIPLIPGVNEGEENIRATARLAKEVHAREIHLLPFHQMGQEKWHGLDADYELEAMHVPTGEMVDRAAELLRQSGIAVNIGGHGEYRWI